MTSTDKAVRDRLESLKAYEECQLNQPRYREQLLTEIAAYPAIPTDWTTFWAPYAEEAQKLLKKHWNS